MKDLKYEYMLHTWGGFYNEEHKHDEKPGYKWFDSDLERDKYVQKLKTIEEVLGAKHLMITVEEGYNTRTMTILNRISKYKGKVYHSTYEMGYGYPYDAAKYHIEWKWTPSFNDDIISKDVGKKVKPEDIKIIQEWIIGAFVPEY